MPGFGGDRDGGVVASGGAAPESTALAPEPGAPPPASGPDPTASAPPPPAAGGGPRRRGRLLALGAVLVVTGAFYFWTATSGGYPANSSLPSSSESIESAYNQLATAFLHGHLSLLAHPPKALLALRNPYNPHDNQPFQVRFHDLAFYHGHFYVTWGPTPVVTLLIPWHLLGLGAMPVNVAALIFFWFGLLFALLLLCTVVDRYLPGTPLWKLTLGAVALAVSNVAPFALRRPLVYELAIASGYCFAMLGAWLLASETFRRRVRPWRLALASLAVGLAAGGRPSLALEGLLLVAALVYLLRRSRATAPARVTAAAGHARGGAAEPNPVRLGAALLGPFLALAALLLAYNQARFGSPLQVGTQYTITNWDVAKLATTRVAYLGPGLANYFAYPVQWTYAFPYFSLGQPAMYSATLPRSEITGGLLTTTPIVVVLVPGLVVLWRRRRRDLAAVLLASAAVGLLIVAFVSIAFWSTTMRYEVDFATFLLVPSLVSWFALTERRAHARRRWPRRLLAVVGTVAILYGCLVGVATSLYGYNDNLRAHDPGTYWRLARITSGLPTVATMLAGHPVLARAFTPGVVGRGNEYTSDLSAAFFQIGMLRPLDLEIYAPSTGAWALAPTFWRAPGARHAVEMRVLSGSRVQQFSMGTRPRGVVLQLRRGLNVVIVQARTSPSTLLPLINTAGLRLEPRRLR